MAEEPTGSETDPTPEPPATPKEPAQLPDDHPLVKAYQATKNELAQAKSRVKEFEDATKSESERIAEKLADAQKQAAEAATSALRLEVALDKAPEGLSPAQVRKLAKRLTGSTREELEADAAELFEDFAATTPPTRQPAADLKGGTDPETDPPLDGEKLAEDIFSSNFL